MLARRSLLPLGPLAVRAVLLYAGLRLLLLVVSAILGMMGGDAVDNPLAITILAAALGIADLHRRHEVLLWANLGYSMPVIATLFAASAAVFEVAWMFL